MVKHEGKPVRVRLAPSPTGPFHIGTARTALFNWLFARQNNGKFILRIEDTDPVRSKKEYEIDIFEGLKWLGLTWDEGPTMSAASHKGKHGPYRQSERTHIYKKYLEKLLGEKKAYYCYCTKEELEAEKQAMLAQGLPPKYSGHCRNLGKVPAEKNPQVIRFKTPEAQVEFKDIIRGKVSFDAALFGDMVIAKDLDTPLFTFAGVVDDEEMQISHVIRGEDHLSNTPKQILFQKALGFNEPEYAHLPLILNPDRSKMSKRLADTALLEYRKRGYLADAIVNFLGLLGWHPKDNQEVLTLSNLMEGFDLKRVQKAGAVFNLEKLDWLQKEHMKNLSTDEIADRLMPLLKEKNIGASKEFLKKVVNTERTRLKTFAEFWNLAGFFFELPDYQAELLVWQKGSLAKIREILTNVSGVIKDIRAEDLNRDIVSLAIAETVNKEGRGLVLWPLRVALSGLAASPDPLEIIEILGVEETLRRINIAVQKIDGHLKK